MENNYEELGIKIDTILLPKESINMTKWAVVACDQYSSEMKYWKDVEKIVGKDYSTYNLIFPEAYLEKINEEEKINLINSNMKKYIEDGIFREIHNPIYVERNTESGTRNGIVLCVDLEKYDFSKGSKSLIRATEGTILERIPPRVKVRKDAVLEFPHIMILIDDDKKTIIEPLEKKKNQMNKLYDFELMQEGGMISGYEIKEDIFKKFKELYDEEKNKNPNNFMFFAVGDGNHSLATAKTIWEEEKKKQSPDMKKRFALVEINNVHDESIIFDAIHRVLFDLKGNIIDELSAYFKDELEFVELRADGIDDFVNQDDGNQKVVLIDEKEDFVGIIFTNPKYNISVATLQHFLDDLKSRKLFESIDYIHGKETLIKLSTGENNVGFYLPSMKKSELFPSVIKDGALPRKTFSIGHANEKRFYLEGRKIN
jgi:hypothetical protein